MNTFHAVAVAIVGVGATARLTRLLVFDSWPPSAWIRVKWHNLVHDNDWAKLVDCHYCAAPWFAALVFGVGELVNYNRVWWIFCGWLAASYAAAIVVSYDGDE